ncbi:FxsA family protein [Rhodococcus triatomae]|uniref:UPF0716 protein FxsA n=1 Tax=Rhodococcus triatomae TaxID=300028 RepID=A0A1G8NYA1_9NOCA|nr:FxsA family protein [Rhodococcus triatomae]QNG18800.1 FxsA family protein [Rhodococcus triatomae]QNG25289.1 FxsA family protein [Rhodococcus triatomae]SDI85213.1 UPF0716 protein FxsA [Rhodococcus triatomae]
MYAVLFLLYVFVEVTALIVVGSAIGAVWTVLLLLAGTAVGLILMRSQWRRVVEGFRKAAAGRGEPGTAVADGALVAAGSVLMFVPGLVTSVLGLALLLPPTRWAVRPLAVLLAGRRAAVLVTGANTFGRMRGGYGPGRVVDGDVVEGEVVDEVFEDGVRRGGASDPAPGTSTPGRSVLP